ncbi:hypothetical protein [Arthrobacter sp. HY1533]|uniref:hypothetical protein n=1 Tax=Arthrobacter sp. HY1533 TaxID=2970919 RepID=UPI0022B9EE3D|nr:hypothetical protein [Arthrobacter sp. HY1533]
MVYWLFTYIFMGMAPYVQQRLQIVPGTTLGIDESLFGIATTIVLIGNTVFILGSWLANRRGKVASAKPSVVSDLRANALAAGALGFAAYYVLKIGPSNFLLSLSELALARSYVWPDPTTNVIITGAASMSLLVAFAAQMQLRQQRRFAEKSKPLILPLTLMGALLLVVNPISSPRYIFGTVALAIFASMGAYATVDRFKVVSLSAMVGLVTLFPIMDAFRHSTHANIESDSPISAMTTGDFDAFAQLVNTVEYVHVEGITWGNQLLGVLLFWVPRSLWESKPVDTGILLARFKGYSFENLSAPIWAEFYINGGWIFLVVGMFALGYLLRTFDVRAEQFLESSRIPPLLGCILPFYLLIVLRGSLLTSMAYLLVILLCVAFVTPRSTGLTDRPHTNPAAPTKRGRL